MGTGPYGPTQTDYGTLFPLQYMASRHSRWKVWLHLVRRPTTIGPRALLSVTSLYPEATDSFSIQMMQSCREHMAHTHHCAPTVWVTVSQCKGESPGSVRRRGF